MNAVKLTRGAHDALHALRLQRGKLEALRKSCANAQDLNFLGWWMWTIGVFRKFLADSAFFAIFKAITFEPDSLGRYLDEIGEPDPFTRGCDAAEACLDVAIEHIQLHGLDERVREPADAAADQHSQGAQTVLEREQRRPSPSDDINDLSISFRIDGAPPSPQIIKVTANQPVIISRLEYLLPDERCMVSQEFSLEGESIDVPLSKQCIDELYKAPRPTGSTYDGSVIFRITTSAGGRTRTYTFPAYISALLADGVAYWRAKGSKDFVGGA